MASASSVLTVVARIRAAKTPDPTDIANVGSGLQQQIYSIRTTVNSLQTQIAGAAPVVPDTGVVGVTANGTPVTY